MRSSCTKNENYHDDHIFKTELHTDADDVTQIQNYSMGAKAIYSYFKTKIHLMQSEHNKVLREYRKQVRV